MAYGRTSRQAETATPLDLRLDRSSRRTLAEQIRLGIVSAIGRGALAPGARLPSWVDLAAQLGVARGTVKTAYERLADEQFIVSSRPGGTWVAEAKAALPGGIADDSHVLPATHPESLPAPAVFQMGVPASDGFPTSLLARLRAHAARAEVAAPAVYPDARGELELRTEIAAYVALSRGIACRPSQVLVTAGFSGALGLTLRVLATEGRKAWMENPGFFQSRGTLQLSRVTPVPIPVDDEGIDVAYGVRHAPDAALALVTPGQQAPLGATLSLARRVRLLEWASTARAWIIEDDYLGELQLKRRAAPALASLDRAGRVIHVGSFSKSLTPALRLGFIVLPAPLVARFWEAVKYLAPAPGPAVQWAVAEFMREGHYLRHLRRMKRLYAARSDALRTALEAKGYKVHAAGLAILLRLPHGAPDRAIAREARARGLAPSALRDWFDPETIQRPGLLLGVANVTDTQRAAACERLHRLIGKFS